MVFNYSVTGYAKFSKLRFLRLTVFTGIKTFSFQMIFTENVILSLIPPKKYNPHRIKTGKTSEIIKDKTLFQTGFVNSRENLMEYLSLRKELFRAGLKS